MVLSSRARFASVVLVLAGVASGWTARAQSPAAAVPPSPPNNDAPNPYQTVENYFQLPEGRTWGSLSSVDIDRDGKSIWVAERCGANSCNGSSLPVVIKFDSSGKPVRSFGSGMFVFPHGIHVDRQGNVWIVDGQGNMDPARGGRAGRTGAAATTTPVPAKPLGHQVIKFSPEGRVLLTLGTAGVAGADDTHFNMPSDVVTAPNGDIFVADGHGGQSNARIVKFDQNGKFIKTWGKLGSGPGEMDIPHAIAMDSRGRIVLADRNNNRLQIFDQDGNFIAEMRQFSRPSGLFIDKNDIVYVADSESNKSRSHGEWKRGIRIGSLQDGKVTAFIPDSNPNADEPPLAGTSGPEGVAVDARGNIYGAQVGQRSLMKYVKP